MSGIAVITGGAGGIGTAIAEKLIGSDHTVVSIDLDQRALDRVAEKLPVNTIACDITDPVAVNNLVREIVSRFGGIDIWVNAAGIAAFKSLTEHDDETWGRILAVNLTAPFQCIRAALPALQKSSRPRVVNITSRAAHKGRAGTVAYSASKGGLLALTRVLAAELGQYGITVNAVAPGTTATPLIESTFSGAEAQAKEARDSGVVLEPLRLTQPCEIAAAVAFLCGPDSGHITGTTLHVNGGTYM